MQIEAQVARIVYTACNRFIQNEEGYSLPSLDDLLAFAARDEPLSASLNLLLALIRNHPERGVSESIEDSARRHHGTS